MKSYPKLFSLISVLLLLFALAACDVSQPNNPPKPVEDPAAQEKTTKEILDEMALDVEFLKLDVKYSDLTKAEYEYLYFGMYPNREVTNEIVVKALDKISETNERGYLELDGYEFKKVTVVNNHKYASPEQQGDDLFQYGTGYKVGTTHYFLVEPICWKVLKVSDNEFLLQTEAIIDAKPFNTSLYSYTEDGVVHYPSEYELATIRPWLNEEFFNLAFSETEQELFIEVNNINQPSIIWITEDINPKNTLDKVFLPSYQEVLSFDLGFINSPICDDSRKATATDYANSLGLIDHTVEGFTTSIWAIRTSMEYVKTYMSYVGYDGYAGVNFYLDAENVGIRPLIKIRIDA